MKAKIKNKILSGKIAEIFVRKGLAIEVSETESKPKAEKPKVEKLKAEKVKTESKPKAEI